MLARSLVNEHNTKVQTSRDRHRDLYRENKIDKRKRSVRPSGPFTISHERPLLILLKV